MVWLWKKNKCLPFSRTVIRKKKVPNNLSTVSIILTDFRQIPLVTSRVSPLNSISVSEGPEKIRTYAEKLSFKGVTVSAIVCIDGCSGMRTISAI